MLNRLFRLSSHPVVRWWWSMDRTSFFIVILLMIIGGAAVASASIAVVDTYEVSPSYFLKKQLLFSTVSFFAIVWFSLLNISGVRRMGILLFLLAVLGVLATLLIGVGVKGAQRWIYIAGVSLQPSEILKPTLAILLASLLSSPQPAERARGFCISLLIMGVIGGLLLLQPDFGMLMMLCLIWGVQVFLSGVPFQWLLGLMLLGTGVVVGGYFSLSHVKSRVDRFLDPSSGDTYQVDQARDAFLSGGIFGRGPGEGVVKHTLPDAHTDFIFAVIGEEFGVIACLLLLVLYATFVYRGFSRTLQTKDRFTLLASAGLLTLFGAQVLVNMGVVLNVLPTTGMTLPFISYGGSATLSMAITAGLILSLSRKRGEYSR